MIALGLDSLKAAYALLVDNTGKLIISPASLTSTGLAVRTDASGDIIVAGQDVGATPRILLVDSSGRPLIAGSDSVGTTHAIRTDTVGNLLAQAMGWYNGNPQKAPIPLGASDRIAGLYTNLNLPAGTSTATVATVPANEMWWVTVMNIQYTGTTATILRMSGTINGNQVYTIEQRGLTSNQVYINNCNLILFPTDTIDANVVGATLNDDLIARYAGYKIALNQ